MKSVFKGRKVKEVYFFGSDYWRGFYGAVVRSKLETIEYQTFLEIDLKEPPINAGDSFYVHETEESFKIEKAMRGTNDTMVYFTNKVLETIVDEESKAKAEEDQREYEAKIAEKESQEKARLEAKQVKKTLWQRIFS